MENIQLQGAVLIIQHPRNFIKLGSLPNYTPYGNVLLYAYNYSFHYE